MILLLVFLARFINLEAQLSIHGLPESFSMKTKASQSVPVTILDAIDTAKCVADDKSLGITNRIGIVKYVNINIKTQGVKTEIDGKGYIWQYKIQSNQTYSLGIHFSTYFIPEGSSVHIYNETRSQVRGGFTSLNNKKNHELQIADFHGNHAIIEYFEPYKPEFEGELVIGSVSQTYRDIFKSMAEGSGTGIIGINCPQGAAWQNAKHAVCLITFDQTLEYESICSGFLINNVRNDGTPYFQTANHCISSNVYTSSMVFYFNYENSTCTKNDASYSHTLTGANFLATNQHSDFTLLEISENPPVDYVPYFAGWDATGNNPLSGTCISHPNGDPKSIAIDDNTVDSDPNSINWYDSGNYIYTSPPNTHWLVPFTEGKTEGGSSGSPLFDQNQRAVGQLHGGDTITNTDDFGKFSLSWNYASSSNAQLKAWLDPDNTGTKVLDGTFLNIKPVASFSTSYTNVCPGAAVLLNNNSLYATNYLWSVNPSTFKFVNSTGDTTANPQVAFLDTGKYTISLKVTNQSGADSVTKVNYIASDKIHISVAGIPADSIICGPSLNNYALIASGADSYTFNLERIDKINYVIGSDSIVLSLIPSVKKYGSFNTSLIVSGKQGTCESTDNILLKISSPG